MLTAERRNELRNDAIETIVETIQALPASKLITVTRPRTPEEVLYLMEVRDEVANMLTGGNQS